MARFCCAFLLCVSPLAAFADPAPGDKPPSLETVTWAGMGTNFKALEGKSALVVSYVTWCPICNEWSGKMLSDIKKEVANKPVVVLAISTDTPLNEVAAYMGERKFTGPNILHGYDPGLAERFGFDDKFFNYALVGPDGTIQAAGNAGSRYTRGDLSLYAPAFKVREGSNLGEFNFVKKEMSTQLQQLTFPMEFGAFPTAAEMGKLKKQLSAEDREAFDETIETYLTKQLAQLQEQRSGDVPEQMTALRNAEFLSKTFASKPQGKEAREILAELKKDPALKKELAAKAFYETTVAKAGGNVKKLTLALPQVSKKYPGTYYAERAQEALKGSEPGDPEKAVPAE